MQEGKNADPKLVTSALCELSKVLLQILFLC
jgi:hypothetical protein